MATNEAMTLQDLMGEDAQLFNKDSSTESPYKKRKSSLEHPEDCECKRCEEDGQLAE